MGRNFQHFGHTVFYMPIGSSLRAFHHPSIHYSQFSVMGGDRFGPIGSVFTDSKYVNLPHDNNIKDRRSRLAATGRNYANITEH